MTARGATSHALPMGLANSCLCSSFHSCLIVTRHKLALDERDCQFNNAGLAGIQIKVVSDCLPVPSSQGSARSDATRSNGPFTLNNKPNNKLLAIEKHFYRQLMD